MGETTDQGMLTLTILGKINAKLLNQNPAYKGKWTAPYIGKYVNVNVILLLTF
jgi:hypothetical protein